MFEFGSAYPLERNLAAYEAGFKNDTYDLTILAVSDLQQTIRLLLDLRMMYVIPEEENGTIWRIPQDYTEAQSRSALASLPHTFVNQKFYFKYEVFVAIDKAACCKYRVQGYRLNKPSPYWREVDR